MSTILKALRRLERERDREMDHERAMRELVPPPLPRSLAVRLGRFGFGVLIAVVAAVSGAGTYLWATRADQVAPVEPIRVAAAAPERTAPVTIAPDPVAPLPSAPVPVVPARQVAQARAPSPAPVAAAPPAPLPTPVATARATDPMPEPVLPVDPPPPAVSEKVIVMDRRPARTSVVRADPVPEPPASATEASQPAPRAAWDEPAEPLERSAEPPPTDAVSAETKAPTIRAAAPEQDADLEVVERAPVPAIEVERTVWHPAPERRHARISVEGGGSHDLREGDAVGGLVVTEIGPSSVTFEYGGVSIHRRIGGGSR